LLNLYFGPSVNAAYGIANQVTNQTSNLSTAMLGAFTPEITASEGRGDRSRMIDLALRASKFGTLLMILFAVPLIVEMDYVLKLWLREPPLYTALFCQLMLGTFLLDRLSTGYTLAVNAHGKIAAYQATVGTALFLTLPLAWLFIYIGFPPTSVGVAFVVIQILCSLGRVLWVRRLFDVPVRRWFMGIVFPCSLVAIASGTSSLIPGWFMQASFLRLLIVCVASASVSTLAGWYFALDPAEREFVWANAHKVIQKFQIKKNCSRADGN
jgi:O-antigen/teichoic acid export membrane protein